MDGQDLWGSLMIIKNKYMQSLGIISSLEGKLNLSNKRMKHLSQEVDVLKTQIHDNGSVIASLNSNVTLLEEKGRQLLTRNKILMEKLSSGKKEAEIRELHEHLQLIETREKTATAQFEKTINEYQKEIDVLKEGLLSKVEQIVNHQTPNPVTQRVFDKGKPTFGMHILDEEGDEIAQPPVEISPQSTSPLSPEMSGARSWFQAAKFLASTTQGKQSTPKNDINNLNVVRVPATKRPRRVGKKKLYTRSDDPL